MEARVGSRLWVAESFFTLGDRRFHDLVLYYRVEVRPGCLRDRDRSYRRQDGGAELIFRWFPVDRLEEVNLVPAFLRRGLGSMPASFTHVSTAARPRALLQWANIRTARPSRAPAWAAGPVEPERPYIVRTRAYTSAGDPQRCISHCVSSTNSLSRQIAPRSSGYA